MANITINSTPTRIQYTAAGAQTVFTYAFPIKANTDLKVYQRAAAADPDDPDDLLTLTTDYTVTGADTANGGTVVLVVGATAGDIVTIVGDKPIDRTAIYDQSSTLKKADLNNDFNDEVMYDKQIETIQEQITPKYNRSELVGNGVRPDKLRLPMLNDGYIWIGRGDYGDDPDDIIAAAIGDFDNLGILSARYILQEAHPALPNAQSLGLLAEGIVYNTPTAGVGVLSILNIGIGLDLNTATNTLSATGGGAVVIPVTQVGHGLAVENVIRFDGTEYVLAQANTPANAEVIGIVIQIVDANNFVVQQSGYVEGVFAGKTPGVVYFLSEAVAGLLTTTEPTNEDEISKPMFMPTSATSGWIYHYRPVILGDSGGGGGGGGGGVTPEEVHICTKTDSFQTASAGWQDVPGLSCNVTLTSATSRVLIKGKFSIGADGGSGVAWKILRDAVTIDVGDAASSRTVAGGVSHGQIPAVDSGISVNECFVDAPGAAATYTYKVQVNRGASAEVSVNRGDNDSDVANYFRTTSSIILEIIND